MGLALVQHTLVRSDDGAIRGGHREISVALVNMSTDHAHNIQGRRTKQHARLRMPHHWAVVKRTAAEDSMTMLLLRLAHVLVHVLDEGVIRVQLFASCAHNIARLGECKERRAV